VYMAGGTFTMTGSAAVSGNSAKATGANNGGGGVYMAGGTFNMSGNTAVSGNRASEFNNTSGNVANGGGVFVGSNCTFTMSGGEVSGNWLYYSSYSYGGGVFVGSGGTFRISNGTVYGNESTVAQNLRNSGAGAALYNSNGTAQYGAAPYWTTFGSGTVFINATIRVVNGTLQ